MSNPLKEIFDNLFVSIPETHRIEFDPGWSNGTGYMDGAVLAPLYHLTSGKEIPFLKTVDDHNRKIVIIPTKVGNVVVFERYSPGMGSFVLVTNYPERLKTLFASFDLEEGLHSGSPRVFSQIFGLDYKNRLYGESRYNGIHGVVEKLIK